MKIMFDSNAFDKIAASGDYTLLINSQNEYYITTVQRDELNNIANENIRSANLHILDELPTNIAAAPAIFDEARLDACILISDDDIYHDLLKPSKNNIHDAMIGSAAKRENCCVVTNDKDFRKRLLRFEIKTMDYEEFMQYVKSD